MPDPVPIQFGITDLDTGGAEKALVELVTRLDRSRWDVSVVCLKPLGTLSQSIARSNIPLESLELRSPHQLFTGIRRWKRILDARSPRLLATFLFHANLLGRAAAKQSGIPHLSGVRVAERQSHWHHWLDRWTRSWTMHYVCVSQDVARLVEEKIHVPSSKITVIPNGVDLLQVDAATPQSPPYWNDAGLRLLCLGRLTHQKGIDVLLDAITRIKSQARSAGLRLVVAGEGPLKEKYQACIVANDLTDIVMLAGMTDTPLGWIKASDGLVLSSRWEGMPNVVLEAMAAEKPVIATSTEGTSELVEDGTTGWLVPIDDAGALSETIVDWMADADKRLRFGHAGRRRIEDHYRIETVVQKWEELLERCLNARPT